MVEMFVREDLQEIRVPFESTLNPPYWNYASSEWANDQLLSE